MPKKFKGENSKAVEARARKAAAEDEKKAAAKKAAEDDAWRDDDKHASKKAQRKVTQTKPVWFISFVHTGECALFAALALAFFLIAVFLTLTAYIISILLNVPS